MNIISGLSAEPDKIPIPTKPPALFAPAPPPGSEPPMPGGGAIGFPPEEDVFPIKYSSGKTITISPGNPINMILKRFGLPPVTRLPILALLPALGPALSAMLGRQLPRVWGGERADGIAIDSCAAIYRLLFNPSKGYARGHSDRHGLRLEIIVVVEVCKEVHKWQ